MASQPGSTLEPNALERGRGVTASDLPEPTPAAGQVSPSSSNGSPREVGRQVEPGDEDAIQGQQEGSQGSSSSGTARTGPAAVPFTHRCLRHLAILGLLINASIWGTLTRQGLIALNTYSGQSITPVIWAQAVGCLVMGWVVANKQTLEGWYPPLFIALGTGYCGSVTTFSSWTLQVFQAYSNQPHYNRHGLHNVMDALTQTAVTIGMSLIALAAGKALAGPFPAEILERVVTRPQRPQTEGSGPSQQLQNGHSYPPKSRSEICSTPQYTPLLDLFCFFVLGLGFWLGAALLAGLPPSTAPFRPTVFAITFAPPGTWLRWYLSPLNSSNRSKRWPYWPLGTFTANILAITILSGLFVAEHYGPRGTTLGAHTTIQCQVLNGLNDGFCGCLSTISTFAVELRNLRPRRRAVGYAFGSYAVAMAICVVVIGSPWWRSGGGMDGSCSSL